MKRRVIEMVMVLGCSLALGCTTTPSTGTSGAKEAQKDTTRTTVSAPSCPESGPSASSARSLFSGALRDEGSGQHAQEWLQSRPRVKGGVLVEGDLLLTEEEAREYFEARTTVEAPLGPSLLVNVNDGEDTIWPKGARRLTYAVDRGTFSGPEEYEVVVREFAKAARQWALACPGCGLDFVHVEDEDVDGSADEVTFMIKKDDDASSPYLALAFFPDWSKDRHVVWVGPKYFTTSYDKTGVFRHEIGHILGYRHEHIRGIAGCYMEDDKYRAVTCYDPHSVMHYYCGGAGSRTFELSTDDIAGHRKVYGG